VSVRLLLDTHIVVRWLCDAKRLSGAQHRAINQCERRGEPLGVSAISLLEIAVLAREGELRIDGSVEEFLESLDRKPFRILPLTPAVAFEAGSLRLLKDPADRVIAATARVHGLRLVTSDERVVASCLVSTVD
jgi:PIN domain nuclease of toxin-antitoxin system